MDIEIIKISDKAITPVLESNALTLHATELLTEIGKDGRLVIIYRTGLSVSVPDGFIGVITPTRLAPIYSLDDAAGLQVLSSGYSGEIVARYKVNTTSVPSIFEEGDEFARLIFVPILDINLKIEEYKGADEGAVHEGTAGETGELEESKDVHGEGE